MLDSTAQSPFIDYALAYVTRFNVAVLPLNRLGKKPHEDIFGSGWHFCECTREKCGPTCGHFIVGGKDPDTITQWWGLDPAANLGVITGARSRLLDLDVDVKSGDGHESFRRWASDRRAEGKILPDHPVYDSPTGGCHRWFRLPEGLHLPTKTGWLQHVDAEACGGLVVVPPSGRMVKRPPTNEYDVEYEEIADYAWESHAHVLDILDAPDAPEWLIEDIKTRCEGKSVSSVSGVGWKGKGSGDGKLPPTGVYAEHGFGIAGEGRNIEAFRLACRLWTVNRIEREVERIMRVVWESTPDPYSFSWHECTGAMRSAQRRMAGAQENERAHANELANTARNFYKNYGARGARGARGLGGGQ